MYGQSVGVYGDSPYIYPLYGLSNIPEGFSRLSAVYGGVNMLRTELNDLHYDQETGKVCGVTATFDEMNGLGSSAADDKKYEILQEDRLNLFRDATPYLKSVLEQEPNNINAAKTLMNIYSVLGDTANFKALKAKVDTMGGDN